MKSAVCLRKKEMVIEIPYETPSKKNSRVTDTRTGRSFPSKTYREWHDRAYKWLVVNYGSSLVSFNCPVRINMSFTHGTMQRCDSDNKVSSILDLLVDLRLIADDCWTIVRKMVVVNDYKNGSPKCVIEIEPYDSD